MGAMTSSVAAKFAFFPPSPPSYRVVVDESTGGGKLKMTEVSERANVDVLKLKTKRGTEIVAAYVKNPVASLTLLYSHGNAADLGQMIRAIFREAKCQNTYADIEAAYQCLEETYGVKEEDVILYGQSVGSGPTLDLAARLSRLRAVVLHSPILSGLRVIYPVKRTYWFDIYKNIDKIPLVRCPVLVIHGTDDDVVDCSHGKQLYELCEEKYEPLWIKGGSHCDLELYPEYIRHLKKFISNVEKSTRLIDNETKPRISIDKPRASTSLESKEKSRSSVDQPEKGRNSIDRFGGMMKAAVLCNIDCFKPTGAMGV